ncbi:NAD(+) kinase [Methylohalobius crimeensis]|uniref:NAD(+) kinase n=1 Tax=Methylohalobius crimeensis TaxID=244365 RepID=UPI0003B73319|nr:NAD(+) kinase [Methylohalobius crimeensis]
MSGCFHTIGIVAKPNVEQVGHTLQAIYAHLRRRGFELRLEDVAQRLLDAPSETVRPIQMLGKECDVVIAVGGDGTLLNTGRSVAPFGTPVIGVNLGRVGFLVDVSPQQALVKLDAMLAGHYRAEERPLLRAQIVREGGIVREELAVNEVVVHRWITPCMIEIITHIDGRFLNSQRADGLIVSTPTGSTAYALSGGGPILYPTLDAIELVPINPHTLTNRPIVIAGGSEVEIAFGAAKDMRAEVSCDTVSIPEVRFDDHIRIRKADQPLKLLHPVDYDFFEILRVKLNWSSNGPKRC